MFGRRLAGRWASLAVLAAAAVLSTQAVAAQQSPPANSASAPAAKKSPRHRTRPAEVAPPPAELPVLAPPFPEPPKWPVNDSPNKPSVTWDASGLKIQANNSSLHDILNEVSSDTGAKVEGIGADERVFGEYGPGTARDVISQLLHGSSYNVLLIGDQGAGTPRQIVLSTRRSGTNQAQANQPPPQDQPDEDVSDQPEVDEQPQQPPMINGRPPMQGVPEGPPGAPRTPQQVLQELQQRQQQMMEQQQQQQQQQPH
jgi:hypothetical protein